MLLHALQFICRLKQLIESLNGNKTILLFSPLNGRIFHYQEDFNAEIQRQMKCTTFHFMPKCQGFEP